MKDPRIGELMRDGVTVYYCSNLDGKGQQYHESPTEAGIIAYLESWDRAKEALSRTRTQTCDDCGDAVKTLIGCPDGAEICRPCFNAGAH